MKPQQRLNDDNLAQLNEDSFFVPDLCQVNSVLFVVILTQLFAFILSLVTAHQVLIDWEYLGPLSLFCQGIALSCAAIICWLRNQLKTQAISVVIAYFMGVILGVTALYSWLACQFLLFDVGESNSLFIFKNMLVSTILGLLVLRNFFLQFQWREQKQAELRARIEALQARIKPHFLFNSMNTIASLISIDPEQAEEAVLDLSSIFRATLNNQMMLIPLEDELSLCRRYLNIEALRLGKRLRIDWQLETDELSNKYRIKIPPLTLQPLVENAIYHGIQPRTEGGTITIKSHYQNDTVYILISNPYEPSLEQHQGNHIALDNIRSRLSVIFDSTAVLKVSQLDDVYTVTLRFPVQRTR
ncbi:MAG: two-component system sensor histidine kinase AlgZ [Oleiphilaceae bacterium]|jgi:two-component system sensor histidine kinase AlgZ